VTASPYACVRTTITSGQSQLYNGLVKHTWHCSSYIAAAAWVALVPLVLAKHNKVKVTVMHHKSQAHSSSYLEMALQGAHSYMPHI
jgi:hypothetical protein